jgi:hypothetical protein
VGKCPIIKNILRFLFTKMHEHLLPVCVRACVHVYCI